LRISGVILLIVGLVALGAAGYAYLKVQGGGAALEGFSDAQAVALAYNDEGQLIDRGTTEGADAIMALLTDEWKWPVNKAELNPDDPITNTATEYMYQMATIAYHTLHGTQNVVITEPVQYDADGDGTVDVATATVYTGGAWDPATEPVDAVFQPGTYEVPVDGRYYSQFDRAHPLEGKVREQAWSGLVHGLFAELGVGATTASSLELGLGVAMVTALMGVAFLVLGGLLVWVGMAKQPENRPGQPMAAA
jgi:hypothetical protein